MINFPCYRCGACCRNVDLSAETVHLDRGDGCCRHYDIKTRECNIYTDRPDICRIDVQYEKNYSHKMTWDAFCTINLTACGQLEKSLSKKGVIELHSENSL